MIIPGGFLLIFAGIFMRAWISAPTFGLQPISTGLSVALQLFRISQTIDAMILPFGINF